MASGSPPRTGCNLMVFLYTLSLSQSCCKLVAREALPGGESSTTVVWYKHGHWYRTFEMHDHETWMHLCEHRR